MPAATASAAAPRAFEWFFPRGFARDAWLAQHLANRRKATASTRVVFLGDSISEGWSLPLPAWLVRACGLESIADRRHSNIGRLKHYMTQLVLLWGWLLCWPLGSRVRVAFLAAAFRRLLDHPRPSWSEHMKPLDAVNMGIGGDRTRHVQWRIDNGELDGAGALQVVVLLVGVNNFNFEEDDAPATARAVLMCAQSLEQRYPHVRVLVQHIFPAGNMPGQRERVDAANAQLGAQYQELRRQASLSGATTLVDIGHHFVGADGDLIPELPDNLHLSEEAYLRWAHAIVPHVAKALDGPT